MVTRNDSLWKTLDWVTIFIYLLLIVGGWFSVCGASYDYGERDFLDFSTRAGKQFVWIICSFGLGFVLLMLEDRMYDMFAYIIYVGMILLLIVTIFTTNSAHFVRTQGNQFALQCTFTNNIIRCLANTKQTIKTAIP